MEQTEFEREKTISKRKKGDRQGHEEPKRETRRTQGDEKKEQGSRQVAIKSGRREKKKDETELMRLTELKGGFFFLKCNVQISL